MTNPTREETKLLLQGVAKRIPGVANIYRWARSRVQYIQYNIQFYQFRQLNRTTDARFTLYWGDKFPCLGDQTADHSFDRHYVYHPAWAARILSQTKPLRHIDISSTLHFCTIVSAFVPVEYLEYRSLDLQLSDLSCTSADLLDLPFPDKSVSSLSCMHVIEHVGLGRYGDPLDPDGDLKAIAELKRVLAVGGSLLFVVPVGKAKIMFNAQRIYSYEQIITYFAGLELREFSLIPDDPIQGGLIRSATKAMADEQSFGCGCFWFVKKSEHG